MKTALICLLSLVVLIVSGCGGGGAGTTAGSATVSGVAAAGAPIYGQITLTDSQGTVLGPVAIDLNGRFSIDATGLVPPFIVKASGQVGHEAYTLYAVATDAGQVNVNPISNAIVAVLIGSDPAVAFASGGGIPAGTVINGRKVQDATDAIKNLLDPLLAQYGVTDFSPVSGDYTANPNFPLDAMLDLIMIRTDNGKITITNKLNGAVVVSAATNDPATSERFMENAESGTTLSDVRELTQRLAVLCSVMNLGASLTAQDLEDLFIPDPSYGTSSGHTRTEDLLSIITIFGANGTNTNGRLSAIRNVRMVSNLTNDYSGRGVDRAYLLNYDFIHENGTVVKGNNVTFGKETATGKWKFIGSPAGSDAGNNYGAVTMTQWISNYGVIDTLIALPLPIMDVTPLTDDQNRALQ